MVTDVKLTGVPVPGIAKRTPAWRGAASWIARFQSCDIGTVALLAALVVIAVLTYKDYAISNDEGVQHHYGELIIAYYKSGFSDQSLFNFQNLYLYGGLFDIVAVALSHIVPIDPYDLRHILCALIGIGGIGATAAIARLIAGPRAGLIAAISLSLCGAWYGSMFNHTKDIPFAAAMTGATLFLIRIARRLPSPGAADIALFGLLAGAALGIRVIGLLLIVYVGFAVVLYLPRPWPGHGRAEFNYPIRTVLIGHVYEMSNVPRYYVPIYIMIRVPLLTLLGAAVAMISAAWLRGAAGAGQRQNREITLVSFTVFFPLACQVIFHGPAFTGLRHFLFLIPAIAVLAGIGLDRALAALRTRGRMVATGGLAVMTALLLWDGVTLVRLHPYEYLVYNSLVGGLGGASRRYDLDYWFGSMPEAIGHLEAYLRRTEPVDVNRPTHVYSVAVCGERLPFEKAVTLPQLHWDFKQEWDESEFFIAPTHLNCDGDLDGKIIGTVERLGVAIAYIKDRRALTLPLTTAKR